MAPKFIGDDVSGPAVHLSLGINCHSSTEPFSILGPLSAFIIIRITLALIAVEPWDLEKD